MTEAEWLACGDPHPMLETSRQRGKMTDRRWRLFAVACCDCLKHLNLADVSAAALEVAERYTDGKASRNELSATYDRAYDLAGAYQHGKGPPVTAGWVALATCYAAHPDESADDAAHCTRQALGSEDLATLQAHILRDIFGNPFRPVTLDPAWLTSDVLTLTRGIYDDRAFDRMPILADALQDAGCASVDILNHCRDTSLTHVRGCWVVDLLLGKQ